MGRCSATDVFDPIAKYFLDTHYGKYIEDDVEEILTVVIKALERYDWDCQQDSAYWSDDTVQRIYHKLHPEWFEDEE